MNRAGIINSYVLILVATTSMLGCRSIVKTDLQPEPDNSNVAIIFNSALYQEGQGSVTGRVIELDGDKIGGSASKIIASPGRHEIKLLWRASPPSGTVIAENVKKKNFAISMGAYIVFGDYLQSAGSYPLQVKLRAGYTYAADVFSGSQLSWKEAKAPSAMCLLEYRHGGPGEHIPPLDPVLQSPATNYKQVACGNMVVE